VIGTAGLFAFLNFTYQTLHTLNTVLSSRREISAIQVMQLYSEGIFYGTMALGFVLSAYVLTRVAN
jgi:hypothetical protein